MSQVWVFQQVDAEPPALIETVLRRRGRGVRIFRMDQGDAPPRLTPECAGLVVMGGPMAVYEPERNPWLTGEQALIEQALAADLPILGICLGAQFLAQAAGAKVYPGQRPKEIGWGRVTLTPAGQADAICGHLADPSGHAETIVFQWHGDTFDLPRGATLLATSTLYPHQAFRVGRMAYGFQFHFEVTEPIIRDWMSRWRAEVLEQRLDPEAILAGIPKHLPAMQARGEAATGAWERMVQATDIKVPMRKASREH
jgi:GMP synthase (glutamine-hydrolysing)